MAWDTYLTDVLGIRQVVWLQIAQSPIAVNPNTVRLLFLSEPGVTPLLEQDIFQKMLIAMKVQSEEILVWEISTVDLALREKDILSDWIIVSFAKKMSEYLSQQRRELSILTTYHPQQCEKDVSLKRPVWETLKSALEKSGLSPRLQSERGE